MTGEKEESVKRRKGWRGREVARLQRRVRGGGGGNEEQVRDGLWRCGCFAETVGQDAATSFSLYGSGRRLCTRAAPADETMPPRRVAAQPRWRLASRHAAGRRHDAATTGAEASRCGCAAPVGGVASLLRGEGGRRHGGNGLTVGGKMTPGPSTPSPPQAQPPAAVRGGAAEPVRGSTRLPAERDGQDQDRATTQIVCKSQS